MICKIKYHMPNDLSFRNLWVKSPFVFQIFTQGACITNNIEGWEIVITVSTTIYLLIEVHQACSEVSFVNLFLKKSIGSPHVSRKSQYFQIITDEIEEENIWCSKILAEVNIKCVACNFCN